MEEKRKFSRLDKDLPARHRAKTSAAAEKSYAKNISAGGMRQASTSSLEVGSVVEVEVALNNETAPYYVQGEVVWRKESNLAEDNKFDMGIRFIRILNKGECQGF